MKTIFTKYIGPTDFKRSRIKAYDTDGNSVTIPYPHELSGDYCHFAAVKALCDKMDWGGVMVCGDAPNGGRVFIFERYGISERFPHGIYQNRFYTGKLELA
jgi:hypothetical protein